MIDSTGLKVFGEGEWKVRKHGKERRRIWRKLHLAVDSNTHEVVCADLSLNNVTDSEAFPGLIRQTHRKIRAAAADGAYDTRLCHDELRRKKISALIPPRKGAGYWPGEYADRNRAVANQRLSGSNARWKWTTEYNRRSIAETAMYRMKQLLGDSLTLRDYDGQVAEAMAMVRALNRMTKAGMPESVVLPENPASYRVVRTKSYLFNKAGLYSIPLYNTVIRMRFRITDCFFHPSSLLVCGAGGHKFWNTLEIWEIPTAEGTALGIVLS